MRCCSSAPTTRGRLRPGGGPLRGGGRRHRATGDALRRPSRTGIAMEAPTLVELAGHPRIRGVKDAKGDLVRGHVRMGRTSLAYYCGIDELSRRTSPAAPRRGQRRGQRRRRPQRRAHPYRPHRRPLTAARAIQGSLFPCGRHHGAPHKEPSWPRPLWPSSASSRTRLCAFRSLGRRCLTASGFGMPCKPSPWLLTDPTAGCRGAPDLRLVGGPPTVGSPKEPPAPLAHIRIYRCRRGLGPRAVGRSGWP